MVYNSNSAADRIYSTDETGLCLTMSAPATKGDTSGSGFKQNKGSSYMGIHQAHIK